MKKLSTRLVAAVSGSGRVWNYPPHRAARSFVGRLVTAAVVGGRHRVHSLIGRAKRPSGSFAAREGVSDSTTEHLRTLDEATARAISSEAAWVGTSVPTPIRVRAASHEQLWAEYNRSASQLVRARPPLVFVTGVGDERYQDSYQRRASPHRPGRSVGLTNVPAVTGIQEVRHLLGSERTLLRLQAA